MIPSATGLDARHVDVIPEDEIDKPLRNGSETC